MDKMEHQESDGEEGHGAPGVPEGQMETRSSPEGYQEVQMEIEKVPGATRRSRWRQMEHQVHKVQQVPGPAEDAELQCEECIKYWLHYSTTMLSEVRTFVNVLAEFINSINFDFVNLQQQISIKDILQ